MWADLENRLRESLFLRYPMAISDEVRERVRAQAGDRIPLPKRDRILIKNTRSHPSPS